ncbi:hypothetical protein Salat_2606000 [Sesamum alatum]|uniref:Uncharacterized protein n=1 Tax=Sesamum alatum TaxID=300844 RepID=A0AAE1XNZ7_9LAMI|nr:hypothetical protein Salat_2606000 [Sesamum alatum]
MRDLEIKQVSKMFPNELTLFTAKKEMFFCFNMLATLSFRSQGNSFALNAKINWGPMMQNSLSKDRNGRGETWVPCILKNGMGVLLLMDRFHSRCYRELTMVSEFPFD